ncbi:MAG TPA: 30S ribosomal protein S2 [Candidatus Bathyarchaeia archaeon]|nr:30S ribosomal protein S2 [Candidatus Bathyarchaeia archaeon]
MQNNENAPKNGEKAAIDEKSADFLSEGGSSENLDLSVAGLLKAGVHFGHKSSRWNPKMKEYVFGVKNNIHIIDLEKTMELFQKALDFLRTTTENGGRILFIGTKPQARHLIEAAAEALEMPYVKNRWLGGTFTNFNEIKRRIKYLNDRENLAESDEIKRYTKYEQSQIKKEIARMNEKMGGIKKMEKLPQAIFLVDIKENALAVKEARSAGIPTVALVDTNTDPTLVDFPIPANDDALSAIKYILGIIAKNIAQAKQKAQSEKKEAKENKK